MVKNPSNNSKPQKSKTKNNNINSQLPKSATGGNVHATDALKHPATVNISMGATSTNSNLDIVPETTPGNASGQSSRDVSTDPTSKTLGPSSGSTPASNSKTITGSISGSKPDNSSDSDDTDEHDDEHDDAVRTQAKHEAGIWDKTRPKNLYSRTLTNGLNSQEPQFCMFSGRLQTYGKATKSTTLKTAREPLKHYYATGFDNDTTPEDVMLYIKSNDINFRYIMRLPPRDDREVIFKLTVPISTFHKTISEESWPLGIFN